MPYIEVKVARNKLSHHEAQILSTGITDIMSNILNKKRSLVSVSVETINPENWYVAEKNVFEHQLITAFVSARITQDTNTDDEKAQALDAIFQLLTEVLGNLAEASYIVLDSLPATDWGYSGRSQESRKTPIKMENGVIDTQHYLRKSHRLRSDCIFRAFERVFIKLKSLTFQPKKLSWNVARMARVLKLKEFL